MKRSIGAGLVSVTAAWLVESAAAAAVPASHPTMRLEYLRTAGAAQCPDRNAVRAAVAQRLGYDPFSERGGRALRCEIRADGTGLRAQIDVENAQGQSAGQRVLTSRRADCSDLVPALLLVLAVAANPPEANDAATMSGPTRSSAAIAGAPTPVPAGAPVTATREPTAEPRATADTVPDQPSAARPPTAGTALATRETNGATPRPTERPRPPRQPSPIDATAVREEDAAVDALIGGANRPESDRAAAATIAAAPPTKGRRDGSGSNGSTRWNVGAGLLGGVGTLPHASWGGDLAIGLGTPAVSIALEARLEAPASLVRATGTVTVWSATAWVVPCVRRRAIAACALLGGGILRGSGESVADGHSGRSPWAAAGLRAAGRLPLSASAAFTVHVDGFVVPLQTVLQLGDPPVEVWRTPRLAAILGAGFVYDFRSGP